MKNKKKLSDRETVSLYDSVKRASLYMTLANINIEHIRKLQPAAIAEADHEAIVSATKDFGVLKSRLEKQIEAIPDAPEILRALDKLSSGMGLMSI